MHFMKKILALSLLLLLCIPFATSCGGGTQYTATITVQDYGVIVVELDADAAPITVENFVTLAKSGFYDGLTFHRIISGFMMQGGDPLGNGTGGSEQTIEGEFSANGIENNISHKRGVISMGRQGSNFEGYDLSSIPPAYLSQVKADLKRAYNSASSQFFICHEDSTYLDGNYAAFGYVTSGMDVVDAICQAAVPSDNNGTIPKERQPIITSIVITETQA